MSQPETLGDFTTTPRVIPISLLAMLIGALSSCVAWALLKLIALFTNLFFYQRWSAAAVSPMGNHLGLWAIAVPVIGALIIGLMARYGSARTSLRYLFTKSKKDSLHQRSDISRRPSRAAISRARWYRGRST